MKAFNREMGANVAFDMGFVGAGDPAGNAAFVAAMVASERTQWRICSDLLSNEQLDEYINSLPWSEDSTEDERTLVAANLRTFARRLRDWILALDTMAPR